MGDPRTVPAVCSAEETAFQRLHTGPSADPAVDSQSSSKLAAAWRAANPAFSMAVDPDDFPEPHMEARGSLPCCVGVDLPGVGLIHAANCPNRAVAERVVDELLDGPVSRGSAYRAGEVPSTLRDFVDGVEFTGKYCSLCGAKRLSSGVCSQPHNPRGFQGCWDPQHDLRVEQNARRAALRDGLLGQLLFAARALAQRNLADLDVTTMVDKAEKRLVVCRECGAMGNEPHQSTCCTDRVLGLIGKISATPTAEPNDSKSSEKEKAPEGETAGADDGIRARGLAERVCLKCGSRTGVWIAEVKPESEVWLHDLALNQCVGSAGIDGGHVLYTHQCTSLAHRGINALFGDGLKSDHEKLAEDWRSVRRSPQTYRAFARMDGAIKEASPSQYIVFGRSLATGTDLYFVIDDLSQVADRRMCIMQSPTIFTANVACTPKGGAA